MLIDIDFTKLAKNETNARRKMRYLALANFKDGLSRTEIASALKVSRTSVNHWVSNFLANGLNALTDLHNPGRPSGLTPKQKEQIGKYIEQYSESNKGGRLQGADIQRYILENFTIDYEISNIYRLLRELNFSWITSRSKHPKQSQHAQDVFKKLPTGNDPSHPMADPVERH
jgi:transposase